MIFIRYKLKKINYNNKIMPIIDPKQVVIRMLTFKRPKDYIIEQIDNHRFNLKNFNRPKDYILEKIFIKK